MADKYTPFPTVEPKFTPTPRIEEKFHPVELTNAVGEALSIVGRGMGTLGQAYDAVGQSYGKLGRSTEGAGDELFKRAEALKNLEIDKQVDQATLKNYQTQGENTEKFLTLQGDQASPDTLKAHMKIAEDSRQAIENTLQSEEAKRRFRAESRGTMGNEVRQMSRHAASQQKIAVTGATTASVEMYKDQAGKADNDLDFNDAMNKGKSLINDKLRHLKGWGNEQTQEEINRFEGEAYGNRALMIAQKDPTGGMNYLEQNKDKITDPQTYNKVYKSIRGEQVRNDGRNISDRASKNPESTLEERLAEADKAAGDDKDVREAAHRDIRANWYDQNREKKEALQRRDDTMTDTLAGTRNPDGQLPKTADDLKVFPDAYAIYQSASGKEKIKWDKALNANSKEDYPETAQTIHISDMLHVMAQRDPQDFLDQHIWDEHIPRSERMKLIELQRKVRKEGIKAADDPQLNRAIGVLRGNNIIPAEILDGPKEGLRSYEAMVAQAIRSAIALQPGRGPLKQDEIMEVGRALNQGVGKGWFGTNFGRSTVREVMQSTDHPQFNAFTEQYKARHPGDSQEQMMDAWARFRFNEEFKKYHSGAK